MSLEIILSGNAVKYFTGFCHRANAVATFNSAPPIKTGILLSRNHSPPCAGGNLKSNSPKQSTLFMSNLFILFLMLKDTACRGKETGLFTIYCRYRYRKWQYIVVNRSLLRRDFYRCSIFIQLPVKIVFIIVKRNILY